MNLYRIEYRSAFWPHDRNLIAKYFRANSPQEAVILTMCWLGDLTVDSKLLIVTKEN